MKTAKPTCKRMLFPFVLAFATCVVAVPAASAHEDAGTDAPHLVYLPSRSQAVDHASNVRAFEQQGFIVRTMEQGGESDREYILRVRDHVRGLIASGVSPSAITVIGSGRGSPATAVVSVATGNRHVNYVMLGRCDAELADDPRFRMSGRVLGVRDADDRGSRSCRPLWRESPKVTERRDLVVRTGLGASLFDAPRAEWLQPVADWSAGGRVDLGEIRVATRR